VEIGKRDILDHGSLDLASFGRNISFMAFDLADIYTSGRNSHKTLWQQLLSESLELVRSGVVRPCHPIETFPASRVSDAFKYFTLGTRIGKVAVSFEDESDEIELLPSRYETRFDPQKTYLMVGCLGGLGRSISRWMILCGARRFVFLGRSGLDKQAARDLVEDLQNMGAKVDVVRGDVGNYQDVEEMIEAAKKVIGGVVQAAMGLGESLWADMLGTNWADSIRPKVQGTWNLHHALRKNGRDRELEFFLMTSSICGTVGVATESNYCASNAFLDAFARYRTSLGLPAISIGFGSISEVGYLHEHQEIENLMKRRGVYSIDENEFLQIMDQALMSGNSKSSQARYDKLSTSHLLTGIEFIGLQEQRELGFEGDLFVLSDPRAAVYTAAFARDSQKSDAVIQWNNHQLPEEVRKALQNESTTTLLDAITNIVCRKMSNLILLPMEKLQVEKALGEYGLDSMLASEFRTFIFRIFEVDVPFLTVLDKTSSVRSISRLIADQLEERLDSKV
jgi:NADP-dependent 3-hydroxy acid dehydrogenase YdfG